MSIANSNHTYPAGIFEATTVNFEVWYRQGLTHLLGTYETFEEADAAANKAWQRGKEHLEILKNVTTTTQHKDRVDNMAHGEYRHVPSYECAACNA